MPSPDHCGNNPRARRTDLIPTPPYSQFNPLAEKKANWPACVWELLRRNPRFRSLIADIHWQVSRPLPTSGEDPFSILSLVDSISVGRIGKRLESLIAKNPFAACAAFWALRPAYVRLGLHRPPKQFGKPFDFYGWEGIDSGLPKMDPVQLRRFEQLLEDDLAGSSFHGPLTATTEPFSLNTPWPKTPPLFQFHFEWLWAEFEPTVAAISARPFIPFLQKDESPPAPGFVMLPWNLKELCEFQPNRSQLPMETAFEDMARTFMGCFVFRVPKLPMTKQEIKMLSEKFRSGLLSRMDDSGLTASTKRLPGLLGDESAWEHFKWCREYIEYPQERSDSKKPSEIEKHRRVIFSLRAKSLKAEKQIGDTTAYVPEIGKAYSKMEWLMERMFPRFDWPAIHRRRLRVTSASVGAAYRSALAVCEWKLRFWFQLKTVSSGRKVRRVALEK